MPHPSKRIMLVLLAIGLLVNGLSACSPLNINITPTATSTPLYSIPGGGSCVELGRHPQPPYPNIQVSHDTSLAHSEPMLVEDPKNPLHLVGGSKFFTDPAHYRFQIGSFASFDGGCTWVDGGVLPGFAKDVLTSDISFAFGTHNEVYAAKQDQVFSDKPWITVDQTQGRYSGAVYVVWSYDHGGDCGYGNSCREELAFSRSTAGGKSFSPVRLIEGNAPFCTNPATGRSVDSTTCDAVQGAIPAVEPDGTLAIGFPYIDLMSERVPTRMLVITSPDGGSTWTSPVLIATIHDIDGIFPPERYRNISLPAFSSDPKTGQLYLTWSDKGNRDADILLSASKDHGQTWSVPIRVNDDPLHNGANQFQPQMVVTADGVVSISFFDTRLDPQHRFI